MSVLMNALRLSMPCTVCGSLTEWLNLETLQFFCCDNAGEPLIHSTKEIRKKSRTIKCSTPYDQQCHILGLNAVKVILNHYAEQCARVERETLERLINVLNQDENLYCCSAAQNREDEKTEAALLEVFIYKTRDYASLKEKAKKMYYQLRALFYEIQEYHHSLVIEKILRDFEEIRLKTVNK